MPTRGLKPPPLLSAGICQERPVWSESAMAEAMDHAPVFSSDTSTIEGSPVRSRLNSAPAMPPAMVMPPIESP